MGPYESCCLGSVNLARHFSGSTILWENLADTIHKAVRFLDDVVTANTYVPEIPELKQAAWRGRRIGLGFMGLADLLFAVGARYGAADGIHVACQIAEFIQYHAMEASIQLAEERGPFPAITGSIFDPMNLKWKPPTTPSFVEAMPTMDLQRPKLLWDKIVTGIKRHGIRNSAVTTVAPTGTTATATGVEGYGIEPAFSLAYMRRVNQSNGSGPVVLSYASRSFDRALTALNIPKDSPEVQDALKNGSIAEDERFPAPLRHVFVTTTDIPPIGHIHMQAAVQNYFSNSISKTINLPAGVPMSAVLEAYLSAYELGCRGITVYVAGSRQGETLTSGK